MNTPRRELDRWGPLSVDYFDHPKTLNLIVMLGKRAEVFPPRMWTWAWKHAPDGVFKNSGQVELACAWNGKPGLCAKALADAGFIDPDGLTIHDWFSPGHFGDMRRRLDGRRKTNREAAAAKRAGGPQQDFGPKDESIRQILQQVRLSKITGSAGQKREQVEAWMARGIKGSAILELVSRNPGKDIFDLKKLLSNGPSKTAEELAREIADRIEGKTP